MTTASTLTSSQRSRAIFAGSIGQFFELYDFAIYGFFAVEIGRSFFPSSDPLTSLLGAFATYGVGFLMRPVGAIVVGAYGDRHGRKAALVLTVTLMAAATGLVAVVPTYGPNWRMGASRTRHPSFVSGLFDRRRVGRRSRVPGGIRTFRSARRRRQSASGCDANRQSRRFPVRRLAIVRAANGEFSRLGVAYRLPCGRFAGTGRVLSSRSHC